MKTWISRSLALLTALAALSQTAVAGSYKHIVIDGNFDDWVGVPIAVTDDADANGKFDFKDIAIANDDSYLYVRIRLHVPAVYANYQHQIVIDGDGNSQTGLAWVGLGSELLIENGAGYQQKNGQFNEGGASQLNWSEAPQGSVSQVEARISRTTLDAEQASVFSNPDVFLSFIARNLDWLETDSVNAVPYTFADKPPVFHGSATVMPYQTASWTYQEAGDPGPEWSQPEFSPDGTWKLGQGLFGFGLPVGVYPPVTAPLASGRTTYYFRTTFEWGYDPVGVALLADAYLSDGAVVYLNGAEVRRVRMPAGAIDDATLATGPTPTPGTVETFSLPLSALAVGTNFLAAEVHQESGSPASLGFGLGMRASDSQPPTFEDPTQPADRLVVEGNDTLFSPGTISGTQPFTYQWFKGTQSIDGATGRTYEIPVVLFGDAGGYALEVTNASGTIRTRTATLATSALPVSLTNPAQPADRGVTEGESTTFDVAVAGSPLFAYQWYKDDKLIDGATDPSLTLDPVRLEDAGDYHVVVTNRLNSVPSRKAKLTVAHDSAAPSVASITGSSGRIVIAFSELVDEATATDLAKYALAGTAITGAELAQDGKTVTLATAAFPFGQAMPLQINGVKDRFGNALNVPAPFRSTIAIDGDFSDWAGLAPVASDPDETGEGGEFKDYWIANDADYIYLRFSFHRDVGVLPVDFYFQIFFDADNDPLTGLPMNGLGSTMMIENGGGWLQRGGGFNEGSVGNTGFLLAPTVAASDFECRLSRASRVNADLSPIFTGDTVAVVLNLVSTSWSVVDRGPVGQVIVHPLIDWPPLTPTAPFAITAVTYNSAASTLTVTWNTEAGATYAVETATDLSVWTKQGADIPSPGNGALTQSVPIPVGVGAFFVQVRKL